MPWFEHTGKPEWGPGRLVRSHDGNLEIAFASATRTFKANAQFLRPIDDPNETHVAGPKSADYGIECHALSEPAIVRNVSSFLDSKGYRKLYKWEDTSIQPPGRTFRISHYYCQFLKQHPQWYFDLRPNADLDGKLRYPEHPEHGWTLFTNKVHPELAFPADHVQLDAFFAALIVGIGFPVSLLQVYQPMQDRW